MPKRKEPELDPKEQFKRFKKAAKEAELDERAAETAFAKAVSSSRDAAKPKS